LGLGRELALGSGPAQAPPPGLNGGRDGRSAGTGAPGAPGVETLVGEVFREEWGRVVAALIHRTGDWDLAEECGQEAFAEALARWPSEGVPRRPGAWLMTVARNRAIDRLRRAATGVAKLRASDGRGDEGTAAGGGPYGGGELGDTGTGTDTDTDTGADTGAGAGGGAGASVPDERLRLIFTCCHPALAMEAQVALTLRTLAGLTTSEIARAFLVPEATMAKRIVRAKLKIKNARIPYRVPPPAQLPQRLSGVLTVLYLLFNEGYGASAGPELVRRDLCDEALRLTSVVVGLMPSEPEAKGLLALMLFHSARRESRIGPAGQLVALEEQDRGLWDQAMAERGRTVLGEALAMGYAGPYQLQAAIAGCHVAAREAASTDWARIAQLYDELLAQTGSPVVELNRAVAVAMADGPAVGLALVESLDGSGRLKGYYLLPATRADLLRRLGRVQEAAVYYRMALDLVGTDAERRFLTARLGECEWAPKGHFRQRPP